MQRLLELLSRSNGRFLLLILSISLVPGLLLGNVGVLLFGLLATSASVLMYFFFLPVCPPLSVRKYWRLAGVMGSLTRMCHSETVLYAEPLMSRNIDLDEYIRFCQANVGKLAALRGRSYPPKTTIILLSKSVHPILGDVSAGLAVPALNAVVISADQSITAIREVTSHELTRLFFRPRFRRYLPFRDEGLATWLQDTHLGQPLDFLALVVTSVTPFSLSQLVQNIQFCGRYSVEEQLVCGSFTGYVIGRFGWHRYYRFFSSVTRRNFHQHFEQTFGFAFSDAERDWHHHLSYARESFEPSLTDEVSRYRLWKQTHPRKK